MTALNTVTGEIVDNDSDAINPWVEVSIVHFLPGTNRLGFVLGSNASPRVSSLAGWINTHGFLEEEIVIEPVIAKDVLSKVQGATEASVVRVKYASGQLTGIASSNGLFAASRQIKEGMGNVSVEVLLRVEGGKRKGREAERERMQDVAKSVLGSDFTKASARILNYDEYGRSSPEDIDFLKHRITKKMNVDITDKEGNPVRISSAIEAIYNAAKTFESELYDS